MKFFKVFLACLLAMVVGSMLVVMLWAMVLVGLVSSFSPSPTVVSHNSVLRLNMHRIADSPSSSPLDDFDFFSMTRSGRTTLLSALSAIEAAATDDRIKGIYINFDEHARVSLSSMEEIRAALVKFKESGKFVVAYNEGYGHGSYYISSVADRVYMHPEGFFGWHGLSMQTMFYKGLLEKLDVEPVIIRHGTFKSAVEPFMYDRMSPENRLQNQTLVNSIWEVIVGAVSEARNIPQADLQAFADNLAIDSPMAALSRGLVDGLRYEDQVMEELSALVGGAELGEVWVASEGTPQRESIEGGVEEGEEAVEEVVSSRRAKSSKNRTSGDPKIVSFGDYASQASVAGKSLSKNKIAVIYAEGTIVSGDGAAGSVGSATMAARIAKVRKDPNVKAVVLRVNSPGGSALASDVMWRELKLLQAGVPLIVSMGDVAASGGYYIAVPADVIYANSSTITGSIGVFGTFFNAGRALKNKAGITVDGVNTNRYSDIGSMFRSPQPAELRYIQSSVEQVYATFVGHVAEGRNMTFEAVDKVGEGRVWSGSDALGIGLVDGIGGLNDAIAIAADRAGVADDFRIWEVVDAPSGLAALLNSAVVSVRSKKELEALGEMLVHYKHLREMLEEQGVQARMPYIFEIE